MLNLTQIFKLIKNGFDNRSLTEYRFFKVSMRHLLHISSDFSDEIDLHVF